MEHDVSEMPKRRRLLALLLGCVALGCDGFQSNHRTPSASMAPTLLAGDWFVVDWTAYVLGEPERGDVVLFSLDGEQYVKRVVGLPGDRIDVKANRVSIDGQVLPLEPQGSLLLPGELWLQLYREGLGEREHGVGLRAPDRADPHGGSRYHVPEAHYFLMGDWRDGSHDSRMFGPVARERIIGRASWIYFSWDDEASRVRWERIGDAIE